MCGERGRGGRWSWRREVGWAQAYASALAERLCGCARGGLWCSCAVASGRGCRRGRSRGAGELGVSALAGCVRSRVVAALARRAMRSRARVPRLARAASARARGRAAADRRGWRRDDGPTARARSRAPHSAGRAAAGRELQIQLLLAATAINLKRLITRPPAAENTATDAITPTAHRSSRTSRSSTPAYAPSPPPGAHLTAGPPTSTTGS